MDCVQDLVLAWRALVDRHSTSADVDDVGRALLERWSQPNRRYHDIRHLRDVLGYIDVLAEHAADADAVRLAAWYHDSVFEGRPDDEELSARKAEADLTALGMAAELVAEVARLIRMTAGHNPVAGDRDGEVLADADLASLAAPPEQYRRNSADIQAEFAHVAAASLRTARVRVVESLLAKAELFRTPQARRRWEAMARENLRDELAALSAEDDVQ
jgi:predicted metal-dependent HD superfamily phosphohydrolase